MKRLAPASVILATYNDSGILEWSLAAFARQSFSDFELILADDGSSEDYAPILRRWAPRFARGILHVRHERRGFRKTRIQNRAARSGSTGRLIFADIDCLPHRDFVRNHLLYLEPGTSLTGRRVHIRRGILPPPEVILARGLGLGPGKLVWHWARGRARVIEHGFALPFFYETANKGILGSNFSIAREDFEAVNGFSEEFLGRGGEDTDIDYRIRLNGVRVRNLRNKLIQFHLMHAERVGTYDRDMALIAEKKAAREIRSPAGLAEIREGDFTWAHFG